MKIKCTHPQSFFQIEMITATMQSTKKRITVSTSVSGEQESNKSKATMNRSSASQQNKSMHSVDSSRSNQQKRRTYSNEFPGEHLICNHEQEHDQEYDSANENGNVKVQEEDADHHRDLQNNQPPEQNNYYQQSNISNDNRKVFGFSQNRMKPNIDLRTDSSPYNYVVESATASTSDHAQVNSTAESAPVRLSKSSVNRKKRVLDILDTDSDEE